ncbi:MAG TPA: hypothetical protein VML01_11860, partial [Bryobacterales bacterium]|nr:hypothetical protein [Bryobacterales bacterium]
FAFDKGIHGYFGSKASPETHPWRFGTTIYGSKGVIYVPNAIYPDGQPYILRSAAWVPGKEARWEEVSLTKPVGGNFKAEGRALANALLVEDLFQAIEKDRKPVCSEIDGRWTVEMITSVYASQKAAARVDLPLKQRAHTLHTL